MLNGSIKKKALNVTKVLITKTINRGKQFFVKSLDVWKSVVFFYAYY